MSAVPAAEPISERLSLSSGPALALVEQAARDLAGLAGLICETPLATLTLASVDLVWRRGTATHNEAVRPDSKPLDEYTRVGVDVFEVEDAGRDERFRAILADSRAPLVFYAGAPICTLDGRVLGVLAVIDHTPRRLTAVQRAALAALASEAITRAALCEELSFARALIENSPVAIYHADETGQVTVANSAYRRKLHLAPTASLRDWANGVHPDDRLQVEKAWDDFCRQPRPVEFEYRSVDRNGKCRVLAEQVVAAEGIPGFVGSITDVTERVATGQRLEKIEVLFRNTVEQAPIGIAYADRDGRLLRCNQAYADMLGYSARELEGMTLADLNYKADYAHDATELQRLWQGEVDAYSLEKRYRRKDRSVFWVRASAALIRDANGQPECSVFFDRDITHRKSIEAALEENRNVLEAIIADVPVAILGCNLAGQILVHNRAAAELFAMPASDGSASAGPGAYRLGVDVQLPDGVTLARDDRPLVRALRGETITNMELVIRGETAPERTTLNSARQIFGQQGEILGAVVVSQDITARKQSELELERVHRQLLDASRLAGMAEVATNVLHNVGNVLNSVNVSASRVGERLRKSKAAGLAKVASLLSEHAADLATFIANDERGKRLPAYLSQLAEQLGADQTIALEELAALQTHIEHIKETVAMQQSYAKLCGVTETVSVTALVEDCLRMNTGALTRHGVSVTREIAEMAPITVDKHKVLQILVNLVRNAKYACDESGRPDRRVSVRVADGGTTVRVSVIDNGVGITAADMPRLFSHGFTTRKSGHGFGLHSAALAARELGGTLTAQSDGPGRGATFILELPRGSPNA